MSTLARPITPLEATDIRHRRITDAIIEKIIYASALVSITIIFLIFLFVGKEALPVFTSAQVHQEVTLQKMILPQNYGSPEAPVHYMWQPVSQVPKYSLMPLLLR